VVGVAFGGGSARGIAHIGIIQWFEEHHIPIDVAAGTSMGGLVGGAFASGMPAAELRTLIVSTDWDMMFGSSSFPFKNVRRKEDARSYPSRLEFGIKRGLVAPTALNDGQQVDLLLARIAAPYYALERFDDLPTPFRVVAVDLRSGEKVVIDGGSLATALRATMSLPGIFPPVERDGHVLVDGGALDNIPADVVKGLGAGAVIAVDVGYAASDSVDYSMFGLMSQTIDAMMKAGTRAALGDADLVLAVDVQGFGSLDWRRADELIARGYQAAERNREALLKYRASDEQWTAWLAAREQRRRTRIPQAEFLATAGIGPVDSAVVRRSLERHIGVPLDIPALERDLSALSGLDRYQAVNWQIIEGGGQSGLLVRAREKAYAPPFLMLGLNVENTTSEDFRARLTGRYLAFDVVGSGSELRIDAALGADPHLAASLHRPIFRTALFVRPSAGILSQTFDIVQDDAVVAQYRERVSWLAADAGVSLSRESELSGGVRFGRQDAEVRAGNPGLPEVSGKVTVAHLQYVLDQQDSPVIPSRGTRAVASFRHFLDAPEVPELPRTNRGVTQVEVTASSFFTLNPRYRLMLAAAGGTSFDDHPLPTAQFTLGRPFRLDAFDVGQERGDHYALATVGLLRQLRRLPDFMGGPIFGGVWLQNGAAFNSDEDANLHTQIGGGIIMDTLVGPVIFGVSAGFDGGWRTFFGIGRIFN
jgi:NTE family protein